MDFNKFFDKRQSAQSNQLQNQSKTISGTQQQAQIQQSYYPNQLEASQQYAIRSRVQRRQEPPNEYLTTEQQAYQEVGYNTQRPKDTSLKDGAINKLPSQKQTSFNSNSFKQFSNGTRNNTTALTSQANLSSQTEREQSSMNCIPCMNCGEMVDLNSVDTHSRNCHEYRRQQVQQSVTEEMDEKLDKLMQMFLKLITDLSQKASKNISQAFETIMSMLAQMHDIGRSARDVQQWQEGSVAKLAALSERLQDLIQAQPGSLGLKLYMERLYQIVYQKMQCLMQTTNTKDNQQQQQQQQRGTWNIGTADIDSVPYSESKRSSAVPNFPDSPIQVKRALGPQQQTRYENGFTERSATIAYTKQTDRTPSARPTGTSYQLQQAYAQDNQDRGRQYNSTNELKQRSQSREHLLEAIQDKRRELAQLQQEKLNVQKKTEENQSLLNKKLNIRSSVNSPVESMHSPNRDLNPGLQSKFFQTASSSTQNQFPYPQRGSTPYAPSVITNINSENYRGDKSAERSETLTITNTFADLDNQFDGFEELNNREENLRQRQFYSKCVQYKMKLQKTHPGQKLPISILYKEAVEKQLQPRDWDEFIDYAYTNPQIYIDTKKLGQQQKQAPFKNNLRNYARNIDQQNQQSFANTNSQFNYYNNNNNNI